MHFASDRQPHKYLITQFFMGRKLFLLPNQQCQGIEGITEKWGKKNRWRLAIHVNRQRSLKQMLMDNGLALMSRVTWTYKSMALIFHQPNTDLGCDGFGHHVVYL